MITDWDFEPTEESGEEEAFPPLQYEIVNYPADTTLKGYKDLFDKEQIEIPDFQREFVWDIKRSSKLVESFLLGLPVPGVFLFKPRNQTNYVIIDGQQRIESVVRFQRGVFGDKAFRLTGVQERFSGLSFDKLSEEDQFRFENSVLRATIIQQLNPLDNSSMYQIFERLNTGGMNLNPMEVRQAISYKPAISTLKKLNLNKKWRALIGKPKPDKRLQDVELILRVWALYSFEAEYEKPMKGFLNISIEKFRDEDELLASLANRFSRAVEIVHESLGPKPFHLRGRLNYGALDSLMAALMRDGPIGFDKSKFKALVEEEHYQSAIFFNTSDSEEVRRRLEMARTAVAS